MATKPQTINSRRRVCEINNKLKNIIISWEIRRSTKRAILPETPKRNFYGIRASGDNQTPLVSQKLVSPRWENAEKLRFSEKP